MVHIQDNIFITVDADPMDSEVEATEMFAVYRGGVNPDTCATPVPCCVSGRDSTHTPPPPFHLPFLISADSALTLLCSTFPPVFERAHLRLDGVIYEQMNAFAADDTAGTVAARMKVVVHDDLTANAEAVATTNDVSVNVGSDDTIYLSSPFEGLRLWWVAGAKRPRVPGMNHFPSNHPPCISTLFCADERLYSVSIRVNGNDTVPEFIGLEGEWFAAPGATVPAPGAAGKVCSG